MGMLRLLLAIVVVLCHAGERNFKILENDGGLAVFAFFVISGFYMALITSKYQLAQLNFTHLKDFYLSRFLRIYPVYWICAIATIGLSFFKLLHMVHTPVDAFNLLTTIQGRVFYIFENIFIFGQDIGRFFVYSAVQHSFIIDPMQNVSDTQAWGSGYPVIGQAWTLAIELTFYLVAPFILTRSSIFIVALCILSFIIKISLYRYGWLNYNIQHAFFPALLGTFLLGSLAYRFIYRRLDSKSRFTKYGAFIAIGIILVDVFAIYPLFPYRTPGNDWVFIMIVAFSIPFLFAYFKNSWFDNWLGEFSYPVYMSHLLFLNIAAKYSHPTLVMLGGALLVSLGLIYFVIKPIDDYRHKRLLTPALQNNNDIPINSALMTR